MLINEITLRGILSFGPDTPPLPMQPLNVLVGPNGSGKSNLISAIDLMRSSPSKLTAPMRGPGASGVAEWIWKGEKYRKATAEIVIDDPIGPQLRHRIEFRESASRFELVSEDIAESSAGMSAPMNAECYYHYFCLGNSFITIRNDEIVENVDGHIPVPVRSTTKLALSNKKILTTESILSQLKDPRQYPQLAYLSESYSKFRIYRDWTFGRTTIFRVPQPADMPFAQLEEDYSNLGLFLNHLSGISAAKRAIIDQLRNLYEGLDDFGVAIKGGTVDVYLMERELKIPASRLSDGTLRYLCLLAILCDPEPPPLICIEEPELGLHPDMIPKIADLLIAGSQRTQLIVTTHSDILIDALTDQPESVVVMEKHDGKTTATRLQASAELQEWLKSYRLGQLWMRGAIGGTRW
jgi:predicted ATPase